MQIFKEERWIANGSNTFFTEWHETISHDFNVFKGMLQNYSETEEKEDLLWCIDDVLKNINLQFAEPNDSDRDYIIMHSTPNYFLFSYYAYRSDIPTYVLLSKDYKRFLIGKEDMELFDDEDMDEDERYGLYEYRYFELKNGEISRQYVEEKEYNYQYTSFFEGVFDCTKDDIVAEQQYNNKFTMMFNM